MAEVQPAKDQGDKFVRLRNINLFHGLSDASLKRLSSLMRTVKLRPNQVLFVQGDASNGCYPVLLGALRVSYFSTDGHETVLALLGKGDVVGEMGLFDAAPRSATVTAQTECELAFIATTDFFRCADADPPIYRHLLKLLSARLRATNDALAAAATLPLSGRLARVLLMLSESFGHPLDGGRILIRQKLTQSDLCSMTGSARENVSRQISEWRRAQTIGKISSYYCLNDLAALRALAKR
jgi:CRP/FNR family transcriptional regulator, cyclic AMP receptor protein